MISVSLFIIITMAGMNALLNANLIHQKSQSMRSIVDNLNFIMDDISKNLRTGYHYHCFAGADIIPNFTSSVVSTPKSCANGWGLAFESAEGLTNNDDDQWIYFISVDGKIYKSDQGPYGLSSFIQLTPDEVIIDYSASSFSILGAEPPLPLGAGDHQQPFVTIRLVGQVIYKGVISPFSIQTSASQRLIDV